MDKTEFLTIFGSFENLDVVRRTLPTIIEETKHNDARLIVHDSSVEGRRGKWDYLLELNKDHDFHLILSDNMSMAHARNMCLQLGQALYAPDYICMVEDDHGFRPGLIPAMVGAMKRYYGRPAPNGLRYGLFTACAKHHVPRRHRLADGNSYPDVDVDPIRLGGANSCFRCAPAHHWQNVLKGYDTDEYLISIYQTVNLNYRNYHKGFTTLVVQEGRLVFDVEAFGRGTSADGGVKLWDDKYTASDARSNYLGKNAESAGSPPPAPAVNYDAMITLGEQRFGAGDHDAARKAFEAVLRHRPDHPDALNNLAVLDWTRGDADRAIVHLEKALAASPLHRDATRNGAHMLHTMRRTEEARRLCARYLDANPGDSEFQALLGQLQPRPGAA